MIMYPSVRSAVQYAPLVCMEAHKRARLSQKKLQRIAGQLMNVDMDIMEETVIGVVQKEELFCGEKVLVQMTHFPSVFFSLLNGICALGSPQV